jgi:hypothetical protein
MGGTGPMTRLTSGLVSPGNLEVGNTHMDVMPLNL